ncbi:hypothetical protein AGMMS50293_30710 [Spirochaetia bacterium]|nr:hypothetical protein AGMMS50293_30710 [Spirochaetia bacterium]
MKSKHTILTGTAILSLFIITFFAGCAILLPSLFDDGSSGSGGGGSSTVQPAAPKIIYVPDGTYTFYPRLQAHQGGVDKNAYLDRIKANGGTVSIYLVNRPIAKGGRAQGQWAEIYTNKNDIILQDLDNPARSWNVTTSGDDDVAGGQYLSFEGVTGTRFSLTRKGEPPFVFEEITLGQPDVDLGLPPLKSGTYTFSPRQRAIQGGVDKNAYIDRIVVRSGYFSVYLVNTPQAKGRRAQGEWAEIYTNKNDIILQDLDHPQLAYNPTTSGDDDVTGGQYITFEKITATRFSLTKLGNPPMVFEEVILGEPD